MTLKVSTLNNPEYACAPMGRAQKDISTLEGSPITLFGHSFFEVSKRTEVERREHASKAFFI